MMISASRSFLLALEGLSSMDVEQKFQCLQMLWNPHVQIVTEKRVLDVLHGKDIETPASQDASGGSPMDWTTSIAIIVAAAKLIELAISVEKYLYERKQRPPTPSEVNDELSQREIASELPPPVMRKSLLVCKDVVEWRSRK